MNSLLNYDFEDFKDVLFGNFNHEVTAAVYTIYQDHCHVKLIEENMPTITSKSFY